jgi:xanthine dehydrogenase small subunit
LIRFILNEKEVATDLSPGMVLLDFIRYHQHLMGTKIGCREGDCGACTVLVGELRGGELYYQSMTCCLMPLGNAHGKHIVTIEGINPPEELNPVQQAMADEGATQCGFCTPGFVISLAGFCLSDKEATYENAIAAIDGNICRCTGYKSIERAAARIAKLMKEKKEEEAALFVSKNKILPSYFSHIKEKLVGLYDKTNGIYEAKQDASYFVGGGTDLYVQKHDEMTQASIHLMNRHDDYESLGRIVKEDNKCLLGPSVTASDIQYSQVFQKYFPNLQQYIKLVSSTPIRNMATIAGNFVNASPIGDFTIFFLALDAQLTLDNGIPGSTAERMHRFVPLRKFYKGYKQIDKKPEEHIYHIRFELPSASTKFNFEKVSKRTNLDIASVNSAISITMNGNTIVEAGISAGGVGPIPMFLEKTCAFLKGKQLSENIIEEAIAIAQTEISPISDARGTKEYKRLLLGQLIKAHFITLFPEIQAEKVLG